MSRSSWVSDCVLLHCDALPGSTLYWNGTTARATTSHDSPIDVSLSCPERPLIPTALFVRCPDALEPPRIVCAVEDLLLLCLIFIPDRRHASPSRYDCDYFIYRAGGKNSTTPSLTLLKRPHPAFADEDVGLLRRGDDHFTIAALLVTFEFGVYDLHRFDSETQQWSLVKVPLVAPQAPFPCRIPMKSERLLYHLTSTVVAIGGDGGTMGWVDLWRGVLLCDVLSKEPTLRGMPMPLPMELMRRNHGQGTELGCPKSVRGITFVNKPDTGPCLRFVHLEVDATPILPPADSDEEDIWSIDWAMRNWTITTWSNRRMSTSLEDWQKDQEVKASNTSIGSQLKSKMLNCGLLSPGGAQPSRALQNLFVSCPAPSIDDNVVYLQARLRFEDPKAFVLALDTSNNTLLGAVEFATETNRGAGITYLPSNINRYIDPEDRVLPIAKVDDDEDDSSLEDQLEGTECLRYDCEMNFPSLTMSA